ncbi:hypothetical protein LUZ60_002382 [Juncus effusus]|nr:hypothetical protein LUZ60_002382 [Juncus effusus]
MEDAQKMAEMLKSLQEKMALMEAENQVLRKHILLPSSSGKQTAEPLKQSYSVASNSQPFSDDHKDCNNNEDLAYWLANSSALLILLQKNLKASVPGPTATPRKGSQPSSNNFFNTPEQGTGVLRQVEAEYPALLFKMQLTALVETIYGTMRDNFKKDLTPLLSLAIQAPRATKASIVRGQSFKNPDSPRKSLSGFRNSASSDSPRKSFGSEFRAMQESHWKAVTDSLTDSYIMLQENGVPGVIIKKLIGQIFSSINVQLFNSTLLRRECCTFSNGEYMKYGLSELEAWLNKVQEEHIGSAWDELNQIKQTVAFLVTMQKFKVSYDELTRDLCPALTVQQMYRICTQFWDDKYNSKSISSNVINSMRTLMTDETSDVDSSAFLLDDDTSIPFTLNEISTAVEDKKFSQIITPKEILAIPALQFLRD